MAATNRNPDNTVFVGNIPYGVTEEMLTEIFSEVGPVKFFRLVTDRETGRQKGFGFCEYYDMETAQSAIRNLGGHEVNGRHLRVDSTDSSTKAAEARQGGEKGQAQGNTAQVISHAEATHAAQGMAAAVGSANMGPGQDQITDALAKMPRAALFDIMSQMKGLIQQNQQQARQILVTNPSLTRALFQAQILLGMLKNPLFTGAVPLQAQQQPNQAPSIPPQATANQNPQQQFQPPHITQQGQQQGMPMQASVQAVRPQHAPAHAAANGQYPPQEHMQPQPVGQLPGAPVRGAARPGPAPVQAQPAMQYGAPMHQAPQAMPGGQPRAQPMAQGHAMPVQPQPQGQVRPQPQDPRVRGVDPRQQPQLQPVQPTQGPAQPQQAANLPMEQQKVLLQQIMQLTPAQIEGLPPEQKAQVLALQQQMRSQPSMLQ